MAWVILCGLAARAASATETRPHVLMVVVDTLRADRVGLYGSPRPTTPAVDQRFARGLVFDAAYTPVTFTAPSVMSLLTGLVPARHRVRMMIQKLAPECTTFPELLRRAGYRTGAVVSNMVLTDEATGLGGRFDHYDDFVDEPVRSPGTTERPAFERTAARTTDAALTWLAALPRDERPHFLWVHYMDPHGPYIPPAAAPRFHHDVPEPIDVARIATSNRIPGVTDAREYVDRYDGEVAFADREIGRLLDRHAALFGDAPAIVVFTSDHGETLAEPDRERAFTHGFNVWDEQARVPLMFVGHGIVPARRTEPVSLLDVAPTILELATVPVPADLDGRSLLRADPTRAIAIEGMGPSRGTQYRALVRGREKWVIYSEGGVERATARRRFLLDDDPGERQARAREPADVPPPALLEALRQDPDRSGLPARETVLVGRRLSAAKTKPADGAGVVSRDASPDTVERLRALGYVQ